MYVQGDRKTGTGGGGGGGGGACCVWQWHIFCENGIFPGAGCVQHYHITGFPAQKPASLTIKIAKPLPAAAEKLRRSCPSACFGCVFGSSDSISCTTQPWTQPHGRCQRRRLAGFAAAGKVAHLHLLLGGLFGAGDPRARLEAELFCGRPVLTQRGHLLRALQPDERKRPVPAQRLQQPLRLLQPTTTQSRTHSQTKPRALNSRAAGSQLRAWLGLTSPAACRHRRRAAPGVPRPSSAAESFPSCPPAPWPPPPARPSSPFAGAPRHQQVSRALPSQLRVA